MEKTLGSALRLLTAGDSGVKRGKISHFSNIYSKFSLNCNGFGEDLFSLETQDRINSTKEFFSWEPPADGSEDFELLQRYSTKSEKLSTLFREAGNDLYRQRSFPAALREYNLAILFGRPGEEDLALAYGNRSATLLEMGHPHLAERDINYALNTNKCGPQLRDRLYTRKGKCTAMLVRSEKVEIEKVHAQEFRVTRPNPKVKKAESFVRIDYSEECGRKLVVTEHVPCGRVLVMEEPFAVSLENELSFDTAHCHRCFVRIIAGLPCSHCPFAMYCSPECLEEAEQGGHQYEHKILGYFHSQGMRQRDLLILRIICTAGVQQLWELYKSDFKGSLEGSKPRVMGEDPKTGVYESGYFQIHQLLKHSHYEKNPEMNLDSIFRSFLLVSLLTEYSTFFSNLTLTCPQVDSEMADFKLFVSGLILDHYESTPFNAVGFNELENDSSSGLQRSVPLGTGIFPTISLINHSCAPSAIHLRGRKRCETTVISLRALNPGDEITITYGPRYSVAERKARHEELKRKYNFLCRCVACNENWPIPFQSWNPSNVRRVPIKISFPASRASKLEVE